MKNLVISLFVMATLASCGSDNKVSTGTTNYSNSLITDGTQNQYGTELASRINDSGNYFGLGQATYYAKWRDVVNTNPYNTYSYKYTTTTSAAGQSNCSVKWKIFYYCTSSSSTTLPSNASISRSVRVDNSTAIVTAKRAELVAILNSAVAINKDQSGYAYYVQTQDSKIYAIDLRYPLQANPIGVQTSTGSVEYFLGLYQ